jgi:ketosteroid isomerase-like protein
MTATAENEGRARQFLHASGARDIEQLLNLMHADVVLEMPFALPAMPKRLQGKSAVEKFLRATADAFSTFNMIADAIYPLGDVVIVEHRSKGVVAANGRAYENRYVTIFEFNASGQVLVWKEYFDPGIVLRAFA